MVPGPTVTEMIATIRADARSEEPQELLAAAFQAVAELEAVGDAVLTHFVEECRRSGRSWSEISAALGVSKQAAHKRFSLPGPKLERFTERARSAVRAAADDARAFGHVYVGTEHLLLGLFEPTGGVAARILAEVGFSHERVVADVVRAAPVTSSTIADPPLTPRAAATLERARTEATALGHNYVGTEHLLLALFGDPEGLAAKILTAGGVTHDDVRDRVVEKLSGFFKPRR
jgi:hypothetical protein